MPNNSQIDISIIVPTFRRADGLEIALTSLMNQNLDGMAIEIIVADNDPKGSAKDYVRHVAKSSFTPIHYIHVQTPGVSNARNGALKAARGRYLAFLDDDQEAGENWLQTLIYISKKYQAALAFVPTIARIAEDTKYRPFYQKFFSRMGPQLSEGVIDEFFGCGNSLMDTELCTLPLPVFSPDLNETGGEDDLLFSELQSQGINIAWSRNARAYEDIRPHRATPAYIKVRSFANGQGPSQACADAHKPIGIAKWMVVGGIQYLLFKPLEIVTRLVGHPSHLQFLARSAEGLGKVLWFGGFTPKLYGAAVVENKAF